MQFFLVFQKLLLISSLPRWAPSSFAWLLWASICMHRPQDGRILLSIRATLDFFEWAERVVRPAAWNGAPSKFFGVVPIVPRQWARQRNRLLLESHASRFFDWWHCHGLRVQGPTEATTTTHQELWVSSKVLDFQKRHCNNDRQSSPSLK